MIRRFALVIRLAYNPLCNNAFGELPISTRQAFFYENFSGKFVPEGKPGWLDQNDVQRFIQMRTPRPSPMR